MRNSSASQLDLNLETERNSDVGAIDNGSGRRSSVSDRENVNNSTGGGVEFPRIGGGANVFADAARIAGRLNASSVSEEEHKNLLDERQQILKKKLLNGITKKENNRLEYIRWTLDRIEDAKYGGALDALEGAVERYENLLRELHDLESKLKENFIAKR